MNPEHDYVSFFYSKFEGRVAIGVGYDQNFAEIYPFVFEDTDGNSIGIVALGVYTHENVNHVHVYHMGSFRSNHGNGSQILQQLCFQADNYQIILSLSPMFMPNGKQEQISTEQLRSWYGRFGFRGNSPFKREPTKI